jgi:hypothetical protein
MKPLPVKGFLLLLLLLVPSETFSENRVSIRSYSPVIIYSSRLTESSGPLKQCIIDADFRNVRSSGIWIIFGTPADLLRKGKLIFKGEGPVKFSFSDSGSAGSLINIGNNEGKGFRGVYLKPGAKIRIKNFSVILMNYPGAVRIITARKLIVNGEMSLEEWMSGLERGKGAKEVTVENISLTTEGIKTVEAVDIKAWVYLVGKEK